MLIISKDNKIIKYAKKLLDKKFSKKEKKTLVESPKIINELQGFLDIECILVSEKYQDLYINNKNKVYIISEQIVNYLSQTETTTGVFAIVNIAQKDFDNNQYLILDNIQDPTNYGAICRSAVAFGFNNIFDINSTYAYSPKVTRCSMGNNFKCNIKPFDYNSLIEYCNSNQIELICCDMNGKDIKITRPASDKFAIIIGNEGNGVSEVLKQHATQIISIPMNNNVESLNASVSAGIVMFNYKDL